MSSSVWLFGAGPMAVDYQKVLAKLDAKSIVFGRGQSSAQRFEQETGQEVVTEPFEEKLSEYGVPDMAILATNVEGLCGLACRLMDSGVSKILVEKPGGMNRAEIHKIQEKSVECGAEVFVGYNRRFYPSVARAEELIEEDGGLLSMHFEFTEWSHKIGPLDKSKAVKEIWALGNSSHVMDLAFYLGGYPEQIHSLHAGDLDWHPAGSIYTGSGKTSRGVLFSYHANWESAGRWGIELLTSKRRLYLKPLEELHTQARGQLNTEQEALQKPDDGALRPGLLEQVQAFIKDDSDVLCTMKEHKRMVDVYYQIANY